MWRCIIIVPLITLGLNPQGLGRADGLLAKHAQANRQQQAQQLLTDDTTERALAYAQWKTEHIANSRCNDNRNSTLSDRIRHSNVTAKPIATHATGTAQDSTQWVQVIASAPHGIRYLVPRAVNTKSMDGSR